MNHRLAAFLAAVALLAPVVSASAADAPAATTASAKSAQPSLDDFLRQDRFDEVKISPDGQFAAATVPIDDKTILVVLKPGTQKPYAHYNMAGKSHVIDFWWVADDKLMFTVGMKFGGLDAPLQLTGITAMNADGTRIRNYFGGDVVDMIVPRVGDGTMLLGLSSPGGSTSTIVRVNAKTLATRTVARAPLKYAGFSADHASEVRFAFGDNEQNRSRLYYRPRQGDDWTLLNDASVSGVDLTPLDFSADNRIAYLRKGMAKGPDAVMAYDTTTGQMTEISRDERFDPAGLVYAIGTDTPIGVVYLAPAPKVVYFNPDAPEARLHRAVSAAFPGQWVSPRGLATPSGDVLMTVSSDQNPGDFYLFNTKTKNAALFISRRDWINPEHMATTTGFHFTARDGTRIDGLLTLPPGSDGKHMPMVVNPHGGPFGIEDMWGFGNERQLLANAGYAVLQVNFRGSGGFGEQFEHSGYKQWGRAMQDDLTDATLWAIQQGIADSKRICIYGASYGGYASLMGVVKEPDLYRCAIGYVGVYDMPMMYNIGDIRGSKRGKNYLIEALGNENLDAISPDLHADRIKVPVFLAAGGEDQRAPIEQSKKMEQALRAAGKSVETLYYPEEQHGFYTIEHNREFYTRVLAFLRANIGPGSGPGLAPAAAPATKP